MKNFAVGIVGINLGKKKLNVDFSNIILSRYNATVTIRNRVQDTDTVLKWTAFDAGMRGIAYTIGLAQISLMKFMRLANTLSL